MDKIMQEKYNAIKITNSINYMEYQKIENIQTFICLYNIYFYTLYIFLLFIKKHYSIILYDHKIVNFDDVMDTHMKVLFEGIEKKKF